MKAYWINKLGLYGDFLIESNCKDSERTLCKYPQYKDLLHHTYTDNEIIVLEESQTKEIELVNRYLPRMQIQNRFAQVEEFLGFDFPDDSTCLKTQDYTVKVLYVFKKLWEVLSLNPSKLINIKDGSHIHIKPSDFQGLNKEKYPKSYALLDSTDAYLFINTLFEEMTGIKNYGLDVLEKCQDGDLLPIESLTKLEQESLEQLQIDGEIYQPKQGFIMKI